MEKNVEVKVIQPYYDKELNKEIDLGKTFCITYKRAKELNKYNLIKIIQIKKM